MALKILEVVLPKGKGEMLEDLLKQYPVEHLSKIELPDKLSLIRIVVNETLTQEILDHLEQYFSNIPGFSAVLLSADAFLPAPAEAKKTTKVETEIEEVARISRQELRQKLDQETQFTSSKAALVLLSTVVAAVGLIQGSVVTIIGAMVLAPMLGPHVALALASTLGDSSLARRALGISGLQLLIVGIVTSILGFWVSIDVSNPEIAGRIGVHWSDLIVALAAGSAGVMSVTAEAPSALIGVMVAVALLPPLATSGLLLGSGHVKEALGAFSLYAANVICINLSGVATFLVCGIRPTTWWEAQKAKKAQKIAMVIWTILFLVLAFLLSSYTK